MDKSYISFSDVHIYDANIIYNVYPERLWAILSAKLQYILRYTVAINTLSLSIHL